MHPTLTRPVTGNAPRTAPSTAPAPGRDEHLVTTLSRGAFVHATCVLCVWSGPARRAFASADRDAAAHLRG